jgi:integrase
MARLLERLTALKVQRAGAGWHNDGGGLYLKVDKGGAAGWLFRYGRQGRHYLGLGPLHAVTLAEARTKARACRALLAEGRDPVNEHKARRAAVRFDSAKAVTFKQAADRYHDSHRASLRSAKHAGEWRRSLTVYAEPTIGALPTSAIDTPLVLKILEPIWSKQPLADRIRQRVEVVLDWAKARNLRMGENPARWRGHLDQLLPSPRKVVKVAHHPALPYADAPAFLTKLRAKSGTAARCLEFLMLTAARLNEAREATWSEFGDLAVAMWILPAARMKADRDHKVPLSRDAVAVLKQMEVHRRPGNDFVFPGGLPQRPIGGTAIRDLVKAYDNTLTVHGLRSTFKDWAAETSSFQNHVVEQALAHAIPTAVEKAYRRGELLEKRRKLIEQWARFCASAPGSPKVIPLGRRHG